MNAMYALALLTLLPTHYLVGKEANVSTAALLVKPYTGTLTVNGKKTDITDITYVKGSDTTDPEIIKYKGNLYKENGYHGERDQDFGIDTYIYTDKKGVKHVIELDPR